MRTGIRTATLACLLALLLGPGAEAALRLGSRGDDVSAVQSRLIVLGFLSGRPDGVFGTATHEAVRSFQRREGLADDGVVGAATLARLWAAAEGSRMIVHRVARGDTVYGIARRYGTTPGKVIALNGLGQPDRLTPGQTLMVPARAKAVPELPARRADERGAELVPWSEADHLFPNGAEARVTDVRTGLSFRVRRIQGTYHADSEPVSFEDTAAMKTAYGGAWGWDRHPVVVEVAGRRIAASMNGYPHGTGHPQRNGFHGHFCLHFYGSRTHGTRVMDPAHQAAVLVAARSGQRRLPAGESTGEPPEEPGGTAALRPED